MPNTSFLALFYCCKPSPKKLPVFLCLSTNCQLLKSNHSLCLYLIQPCLNKKAILNEWVDGRQIDVCMQGETDRRMDRWMNKWMGDCNYQSSYDTTLGLGNCALIWSQQVCFDKTPNKSILYQIMLKIKFKNKACLAN